MTSSKREGGGHLIAFRTPSVDHPPNSSNSSTSLTLPFSLICNTTHHGLPRRLQADSDHLGGTPPLSTLINAQPSAIPRYLHATNTGHAALYIVFALFTAGLIGVGIMALRVEKRSRIFHWYEQLTSSHSFFR